MHLFAKSYLQFIFGKNNYHEQTENNKLIITFYQLLTYLQFVTYFDKANTSS